MKFEKLYGEQRACLLTLLSFADEGLTPLEIAKRFNPIVIANQQYAMCISELAQQGYLYQDWNTDALYGKEKVYVYNSIRITDKARQYIEWETDISAHTPQNICNEKENRTMFTKLPSNTHNLLNEIIGADDPVSMLQEKFENSTIKEDEELRGILHELKIKGFIDTHWADDVPCELTISNLARTYEEQLGNYERQQAILSKNEYNIYAQQVNVASDNSTINAAQYNGIDLPKLKFLIGNVKQEITPALSEDEVEVINDSLDTIEALTDPNPPKKGVVRTALSALQRIKGTAEFGAAVATLVKFISELF